ncbi:DUF2538 family protein [Staphylococcus pseudintermedius]|uniref:DUF2538 family protein n=1 Tax=Staphylococcus pseudintermedius TaxID=283734 RepID=UPI000CFE34F0|nr:DUF2538 family protein [Staphylococcus pseudintermedius]EGQ0379794.1 DUF2538 family protein [Staphylococcus pseudintermedius]EGQ0389075.1 DUF2538 family protein [Staphylococcus pseudintermedius]EGQ1301456.1 DUF2538 family protein [Staphylococcus pseudintermedius]EGQ1635340.1 DUF2538 family protein [Staphylococcus pseudintermedius]EGQ1639487.1 DUF2538 family protein [Staphylococcus pseudintermedius]
MARHTQEKIRHINGIFNMLEQQIIHSKDMAHFRQELFYVNHTHRENYEALLLYYQESETNPVINAACYIVALPEIFDAIDVFESPLPFSWVYDENGLTPTMQNLSVPIQYLVAAALEVTDVNIFKPSGYTMGMNNWNLVQMRLFWQYTALVRQQAI